MSTQNSKKKDIARCTLRIPREKMSGLQDVNSKFWGEKTELQDVNFSPVLNLFKFCCRNKLPYVHAGWQALARKRPGINFLQCERIHCRDRPQRTSNALNNSGRENASCNWLRELSQELISCRLKLVFVMYSWGLSRSGRPGRDADNEMQSFRFSSGYLGICEVCVTPKTNCKPQSQTGLVN